jgi:hypothetical protein
MPNSVRGQMKREAEQAIGAIEKSAGYLLRWREQYDPDYPEYVTAIDALLEAMYQIREALVQFTDQI